jgi:hypothetical protein
MGFPKALYNYMKITRERIMINAAIGHWYRISYSPDPVEVVSLDDDEQVVEIQHFRLDRFG